MEIFFHSFFISIYKYFFQSYKKKIICWRSHSSKEYVHNLIIINNQTNGWMNESLLENQINSNQVKSNTFTDHAELLLILDYYYARLDCIHVSSMSWSKQINDCDLVSKLKLIPWFKISYKNWLLFILVVAFII
jgi:hypothetical protein